MRTYRAYRIVFLGLGTLLVVAALLKAHQLATSPMAPSAWLSPTIMALVLQGELLLGMLLLFDVAPRWIWWVGLCVFSVFAIVSLQEALLGHETCGCFGRVEISPWWTLLIDVVAVGSLLKWRPSMAVAPRLANVQRLATGFLVYVAMGTPIGFVVANYEPQRLVPGLQVLEGNGLVLLEPETWLGEEFPLVTFIENGRQLQTGPWTVVLFHHDCPRCRQVLPIYESMALDPELRDHSQHIALIELPPFDDEVSTMDSPCFRARLSDQYEWFVTTPVEIQLDDGIVTTAVTDVDEYSALAQWNDH